MSHPDIMVGYIVEPPLFPPSAHIAEWNDRSLAALPLEDDTHPPLCRTMFSAPPFADTKLHFRGSRVITFGLHRNYFHADVGLWLPKFESLLKQLLWSEVQIYIDSDYSGDFDLSFETPSSAYPRMVQPLFQSVQALRLGIPARVALNSRGVEFGWLTVLPDGSNQPFNIAWSPLSAMRATKSCPSRVSSTSDGNTPALNSSMSMLPLYQSLSRTTSCPSPRPKR